MKYLVYAESHEVLCEGMYFETSSAMNAAREYAAYLNGRFPNIMSYEMCVVLHPDTLQETDMRFTVDIELNYIAKEKV
jgi:hypothetical protein